jgi:anaerobic selenocysteine-containing dehydrogenase
MEGGEPVGIEGDPQSPVNEGGLCIKGKSALELLHHPDRLKHPLKRTGERGDAHWQRIPWDEALGIIEERFQGFKEKYGAESVAFIRGGAKGLDDSILVRLANVFGTPNVAWQGHVCALPRWLAADVTFGRLLPAEKKASTGCAIFWGSNTAHTLFYFYRKLRKSFSKDTKVIVIDPGKIAIASKADFWLKVRPGSDLALALGIMHVIIDEDLYARDFVTNWTVGFEQLKAHVQEYPPEKVADITWIDAETIKETARVIALNGPVRIDAGNGLEHNVNSFQANRAISILRAITGNLGVPADGFQNSPVPILKRSSAELELWDELPIEKFEKRLSAGLNHLPLIRYVTPESVMTAVMEGEPYLVHGIYMHACNSLLTHSNSKYIYKALKKVDFLATADLFMTPTAALADVVLPATSFLESDNVSAIGGPQIQQKVAQLGECRSNYDTLYGLAEKLGLAKYFFSTEEGWWDYILKPAGVTFNQFRQMGTITSTGQYGQVKVEKFDTPSGKVELYSKQLKEWGFDPLPVYYESPETPYSEPELTREYPLIFTTSKSAAYSHSRGRQIEPLRRSHSEPLIRIHPKTATKSGIKDGDWVYIETKRGRIKQKAILSDDIDPRVVMADFGWWFPEKGVQDLYGWAESNINVLTDNKPPHSREMGSTNLRGILCKVYKAEIG